MTFVGAASVSVPVPTFAQGGAASAPKARNPRRRDCHKKKKPAFSATRRRNRRANLARPAPPPRAALREVQTQLFRFDEFGREVPDVPPKPPSLQPVTGEVL